MITTQKLPYTALVFRGPLPNTGKSTWGIAIQTHSEIRKLEMAEPLEKELVFWSWVSWMLQLRRQVVNV